LTTEKKGGAYSRYMPSSKTKICIFAGFFPRSHGGAEYQAYLLAKSLDPKQFEVFFIFFHQGKSKKENLEGFGIYSIQIYNFLRKFGRPYFLYYFPIRKILRDERPDIIYRRGGTGSLGILGRLKPKFGFRLIWACSHIKELSTIKKVTIKTIFTYFDDLFCAYGIRRADQIFTQTRDQSRLLRKNFGRDAVICRNAHPSNPKAQKTNVRITIAWVANYRAWKQPEQFIKLAERCMDIDYARFVMIGRKGSGKSWNDLENKINTLGHLDHKGEMSQKEVNLFLDQTHIFVNTSVYEGFPNTFIQSWMRGVPVVSLHVNPDKLLETEKIGFHSKTFEQLVKDTRLLIQDSTMRNEMGKRAVSYANTTFSLRNIDKIVHSFNTLKPF